MTIMNTYKAILSKLFSVSDNELMNYYKTALTGSGKNVLNMLRISRNTIE